ncbi:MAG: efflux RND transporter periplasmic adaptor subunit, partial [bacterium]|nr:efflux RND transporter periplasmic adaptor subunit [bacterium]
MTESTTRAPAERPGRKRLAQALVLVVVVAAGVAANHFLLVEESAAVASFPVQQGEFVITLNLKGGELEATKAEQINAPNVRGQLKITKLFPEGEVVEVGDLIIEFDRVEFEKKVTEESQQLEAARGELEKTIANQAVEVARQKADIENKEAALRLAQLQVEKIKFESFIDKEEAGLRAKQAQLALGQAHTQFLAQAIVDSVELRKQELRVAEQERQFERSEKDLANLSVLAENPGLVVYEKIWKGSRPEKIRVGDEPWGGATLVTLPDLSLMRVKTWVNEVDVDKINVGLAVIIRLDALPGPVFHGKVTSVASLGREKEGDKNVKVFDIEVEIEEQDTRLKPGMTASSEVVIKTLPERPEADADADAVNAPEEGAAAELPL